MKLWPDEVANPATHGWPGLAKLGTRNLSKDTELIRGVTQCLEVYRWCASHEVYVVQNLGLYADVMYPFISG